MATTPQPTAADLHRQLDALTARIDDGERRIEEAKRLGVDTTAWEAFWLTLLEDYEAVYRRLNDPNDPEERVLWELSQNPGPVERDDELPPTG